MLRYVHNGAIYVQNGIRYVQNGARYVQNGASSRFTVITFISRYMNLWQSVLVDMMHTASTTMTCVM